MSRAPVLINVGDDDDDSNNNNNPKFNIHTWLRGLQ